MIAYFCLTVAISNRIKNHLITFKFTFARLARMFDRRPDPRLLVLCGPSGSGKSTLIRKVVEDFPDKFGFSISHTTRKSRPGEVDGQHYHFSSAESMKKAIDEGQFIETATFSGYVYGTSKAAVEAVLGQGKLCVLDIDVQGVKQVKAKDIDALYIFVKPPSLEELRRRLMARRTESEESLNRRLKAASDELEYGIEENFDFIVVNDDLERAYTQLKLFLESNVGLHSK